MSVSQLSTLTESPPAASLSMSSDERLLAHLAHGELDALDLLYTRYARPVFTLAVRVLGDASDAEEVTQDVFEQVWRSAHRFDPARGSAGRWIITIAYHVAMTALRRHYRRPQTCHTDDTDRLVARIPDDARAVSAVALDRLDAQQLRRAVRSLPDPQQHAVALAYFADLSHGDVAAVLGTPLGTVKSNIRRGLTRLRPTVAGLGLVPDHEDMVEQL